MQLQYTVRWQHRKTVAHFSNFIPLRHFWALNWRYKYRWASQVGAVLLQVVLNWNAQHLGIPQFFFIIIPSFENADYLFQKVEMEDKQKKSRIISSTNFNAQFFR